MFLGARGTNKLFMQTSTLETVLSIILAVFFLVSLGGIIWVNSLEEVNSTAAIFGIISMSMFVASFPLWWVIKKIGDKLPILEEKEDGTLCVFEENEREK